MVEAILTDSLLLPYGVPEFAHPFSLHPYGNIGQLHLTAAAKTSSPLRATGSSKP
jgi:hypothetical protein